MIELSMKKERLEQLLENAKVGVYEMTPDDVANVLQDIIALTRATIVAERDRDGQRAAFNAATELTKRAAAEVEMLRGVGCNEDGDGPCGACIKCARADLTETRAQLARLREAAGSVLHDHEEGDLYGFEAKWLRLRTALSEPGPTLAPVRWACSKCGSFDVEESAWIKVNSDEVTGRGGGEGPTDRLWCPQCMSEDVSLREIAREDGWNTVTESQRDRAADLAVHAEVDKQADAERAGARAFLPSDVDALDSVAKLAMEAWDECNPYPNGTTVGAVIGRHTRAANRERFERTVRDRLKP